MDTIRKIFLVFGALLFSMLEIVVKIVVAAIIFPAIGINMLCVKLFNAKSYLIPLLAIWACTTIVAAEITGPIGKEVVERQLREKGRGMTYDDLKRLAFTSIREAFRG